MILRSIKVQAVFLLFLYATAHSFQDSTLSIRANQLLLQGRHLLEQGQTTQAQKYIQDARKLQIELAKQYQTEGFHQLKYGDLKSAKWAFEKAIEQNAQDEISLIELGRICLQQKHYQDAIAHLNRTLHLNPSQVEAHDLIEQTISAYYTQNHTKSFKNYTFPCQAIAFREKDSLRVEIAYALPKVGLTRAGGIGVVYLDQECRFSNTNRVPFFVTTQNTHRLPEYGSAPIEKNYLLATQIVRAPLEAKQLSLHIKDRKIGSLGTSTTPLTAPTSNYRKAPRKPTLLRVG